MGEPVVERARRDPVWWIEKLYGRKLTKYQRAIVNSVRDNEETTVRSSHAIGKTFVGANIVPWFTLNHPNAYVVTTAPTMNQIKEVMWKEIRSFNRVAENIFPWGAKMGMMQMTVDDSTGWKAVGYTARDSTSFQGRHADYILVVVDEASGVSDDIYDAIDSILAGGTKTRLLEIGNPTNPSGRFAKRHAPESRGTARRFRVTSFDTPNFTEFGITMDDILDERRRSILELTNDVPAWERKIGGRKLPSPHLVKPSWVAKVVNRLGKDSEYVRTRILAEFPESDSAALFPGHLIDAAHSLNLEPGDPHVLGLDVSRYGGDETVVYRREGMRFRFVDAWSRQNLDATASRAMSILLEDGASWISIDSIGVGGGVVDIMAAKNLPAYGVNVGMAPFDSERFGNLKAELFWGFKEAMERGEVDLDPEDFILAQQLGRLRYEYRRGKIYVESKDQYKKRFHGESPDRAEALLMTLSDIFESANAEGVSIV